jgi:hypothetical protein
MNYYNKAAITVINQGLAWLHDGIQNKWVEPGCNGYHYALRLRPGETIENIHRQFRKSRQSPCMCCFGNHGRMWMLKGNGRKSHWKTKGLVKMHRVQKNEILSPEN